MKGTRIFFVAQVKLSKVMYVALIGLQFIERIYIGPNEAKVFRSFMDFYGF